MQHGIRMNRSFLQGNKSMTDSSAYSLVSFSSLNFPEGYRSPGSSRFSSKRGIIQNHVGGISACYLCSWIFRCTELLVLNFPKYLAIKYDIKLPDNWKILISEFGNKRQSFRLLMHSTMTILICSLIRWKPFMIYVYFFLAAKAFLVWECFHTVNFLQFVHILSVAYFNILFLLIYRSWFFENSSTIPVLGSSFENILYLYKESWMTTYKPPRLCISQNQRLLRAGRDLKNNQSQTPLPWARSPPTNQGCSRPYSGWSWTLSGLEHPQPSWTATILSPSQLRISS